MNLNIPMLNDNRIDIDPEEKRTNSSLLRFEQVLVAVYAVISPFEIHPLHLRIEFVRERYSTLEILQFFLHLQRQKFTFLSFEQQ